MRLGIDLDGVVVDIVGAMLPELSLICGYEVTKEHIVCYEFDAALGLSEAQVAEVWSLVAQERFYSSSLPIEGAIQSLKQLHDDNDIDWRFVTSRPEWTKAATLSWLAAHGLGQREVVFTHRGKPAAIELGLDIFIEDDIETALNLVSGGLSVLLVDNPWNQREDLPPNCWRVHDWNDINRELRRQRELRSRIRVPRPQDPR